MHCYSSKVAKKHPRLAMIDKRRYKRVAVEGIHGNMIFASNAKIFNISLGGVAIEINKRLTIGNEYTLKLQSKEGHIDLKGVVVWSVLGSSVKDSRGDVIPIYQAGLKFTDVLTDKMSRLIEFIEKHKVSDEIRPDERLRGLRFKIHTEEEAFLNYSYSVKKISLGGMLIETSQALDIENRFPMEIFLQDDKSINFVGRVASCREIADTFPKQYDIGIEFVEMSDEDRKSLESFIQPITL
ncbi:MAG: PilZ domain-containing protein [Nitrospirota bacterium]